MINCQELYYFLICKFWILESSEVNDIRVFCPFHMYLKKITANNTQKGIFNRNKTRGEKGLNKLML